MGSQRVGHDWATFTFTSRALSRLSKWRWWSRTRLPMQETKRLDFDPWVRTIPWRRATHSSILAWRIPWIEDSGGLQSIESQRVGHGWSDLALSTLCKHVSVWSEFKFWFLKLSGITKTFFSLWFAVGWTLRCGTCRFQGLNPGLLLFWLNLDWYKLAIVSSPTQGMLLYDSWAKNVFYVFREL